MTNGRTGLFKPAIRLFVGLAILVVLIWVVGPKSVLEVWKSYELKWLCVAALAILASTILGGFNLYMIVRRRLNIGFSRFLCGYWLAWAIGLVVPGQIGDVLGLTLWMKKRGFSWEITSGIALIDKLISLSWMLAFAIVGIIFLLPRLNFESFRNFSGAIIVLALISIGALVYLLFRIREKWTAGFVRFISEAKQSFASAKLDVLANAILTPLKITFIAGAYLALFFSAGVSWLSLTTTVLLVAASSLVSYIPISLNGIGTVELAGVALFGAFDIEAALVVSVFVTLRILVLLLAWVPASMILLMPPKPTREFLS